MLVVHRHNNGWCLETVEIVTVRVENGGNKVREGGGGKEQTRKRGTLRSGQCVFLWFVVEVLSVGWEVGVDEYGYGVSGKRK